MRTRRARKIPNIQHWNRWIIPRAFAKGISAFAFRESKDRVSRSTEYVVKEKRSSAWNRGCASAASIRAYGIRARFASLSTLPSAILTSSSVSRVHRCDEGRAERRGRTVEMYWQHRLRWSSVGAYLSIPDGAEGFMRPPWRQKWR